MPKNRSLIGFIEHRIRFQFNTGCIDDPCTIPDWKITDENLLLIAWTVEVIFPNTQCSTGLMEGNKLEYSLIKIEINFWILLNIESNLPNVESPLNVGA